MDDSTITTDLQQIISVIDESTKALKKQLGELKKAEKSIRSLETQYKKLIEKKKKRMSGINKQSGFAKPVNISTQLTNFFTNNMKEVLEDPLEVKKDDTEKVRAEKISRKEENKQLLELIQNFKNKDPKEPFVKIPRTCVTKLLTRYIKFHELQDPQRRTNILITSPKGKAFGKLLKGFTPPARNDPDKTKHLTFVYMQKYIKHHFNPEVPGLVKNKATNVVKTKKAVVA